jgi:hypothetical protein
MSTQIRINRKGHRRYTEVYTGRCTICNQLTTTECECGRCMDLEPWPQEMFDEWSELTKERDGILQDAIRDQQRRESYGY